MWSGRQSVGRESNSKKPTYKKILVLDFWTSMFHTMGKSPVVLQSCVLCLWQCWWARQIVQSNERSPVWADFGRGMTESDATIETSSLRWRGVRLSCSQWGTGGQWDNQVRRNGHQRNGGSTGEDFITYRRIWEVLGACCGNTSSA